MISSGEITRRISLNGMVSQRACKSSCVGRSLSEFGPRKKYRTERKDKAGKVTNPWTKTLPLPSLVLLLTEGTILTEFLNGTTGHEHVMSVKGTQKAE